jgi:hypothetical protein
MHVCGGFFILTGFMIPAGTGILGCSDAIFVYFAQIHPCFLVRYHDSVNYFKKAIDIFCDVCYTVITEEKELLRRTQGQAISCSPGSRIPRNGVRSKPPKVLYRTASYGGYANGPLKNFPKPFTSTTKQEDTPMG